MSWSRAVIVLALFGAVWQVFFTPGASTADDYDREELRRLASDLASDDVIMYSTTDCPYCADARAWFKEYDIPFTECDARQDTRCATELAGFGAAGVPYMIVAGNRLGEGFGSDRVVAALRAKSSRSQ